MMPVGSTVYLAGPMRGYDLYNAKRFFYWQVMIENSGMKVINPIAIDCEKALYSDWHFTDDQFEEVLTEDLELISSQADWLFVLKGWQDSVGAKREIEHAKSIGLPVFFEDKPVGG